MNRMKASIAALTLFVGAGVSSTNAASLNTDVSVNLSSALSLACYDRVDVILSAETFVSAVGSTFVDIPGLSSDLTTGEGQEIASDVPLNFQRGANLDLLDVCAYQALGGVGGARVVIDALETRLDATSDSYIQVDQVFTRDNLNAGAWLNTYEIEATDLGNSLRGIDVRLRLDLRNAEVAGTYSSPTDGTFRITVTPNP